MNFFKNPFRLTLILLAIAVFACDKKEDGPDEPQPVELGLTSVTIGTRTLSAATATLDIAYDQPLVIRFSTGIDTSTVRSAIRLMRSGNVVAAKYYYTEGNSVVSLYPVTNLDENTEYQLAITSGLKGSKGQTFAGATYQMKTIMAPMQLVSQTLDGQPLLAQVRFLRANREPEITLTFSHPVAQSEMASRVSVKRGSFAVQVNMTASADRKSYTLKPVKLDGLTRHNLEIQSGLKAEGGNTFSGFTATFYTLPDETPKFPVITDEELLTLVQRQTFRYFWDFGHPTSGMARERNTSPETVTTGGTGFGLQAILTGIERGFVTRSEGVARLKQIIDFLETADRFHGVWPHWLNGTTGKVQPFSQKDNGGDLVETSFLAAGMLTVRQYLNPSNFQEKAIIDKINVLLDEIEWDWYTKGGENVLYWHWSPNYGWEMNHKIQGYNECLIAYVLAASSTTHPIEPKVYHEGWARNGQIINGKTFYGIKQPLGYDKGGPLFFAHYSFMGLDPRGLKDQYDDYWEQNVAHTLINRAHCIENPNQYAGYGSDGWGLTASDGNAGYSAQSPTNDKGVITPTAALSSFPYTPEESMEALHFFYYTLGDKLWGDYGFKDAFNPTENWTASSFLAIDQGPIVVMIENYRTGLLWNHFMGSPEVQNGLKKLGFTSPAIN